MMTYLGIDKTRIEACSCHDLSSDCVTNTEPSHYDRFLAPPMLKEAVAQWGSRHDD